MLLTITLDVATSAADTLCVDVVLDGNTRTNTIQHTPGDTSGTVELDFPSGYTVGDLASVTVLASAAGALLGSGASSTQLADDCTLLSIDVAKN
jgi:hypothetical protein